MEVKAQLNNLRCSPRKVRLVTKMIKGMDVQEAQNQLKFFVKASVPFLEKLLKSAVANAENNFGLDKDNLYIKDIKVNEGTTLKRWLPRAYGRVSLILKKTSNIELTVTERVKGRGRKKIKKKQEMEELKMKESEEKGIGERGEERTWGEKKEIAKEGKEFIDEKRKIGGARGFLRRVFRRKSM